MAQGTVKTGHYISGRLSKSVGGGANVTLTAAESRNEYFIFTGSLLNNISVILDFSDVGTNEGKRFLVLNNTSGGYTITVKGATGTGVVVANGQRKALYWDGTNVVEEEETVGARVYHNAAQSIPASTWTVLSFNSERYDKGNCHDTISNTSRLTAPKSGVYLISAQVTWASGGFTQTGIRLKLNGTTVIATEIRSPTGLTNQVNTIYELAAGDYVEVEVWHNDTVAGSISVVGNYSPEFMFHRLH